MTAAWKSMESAKYWWRAWRLYGCGNFTLRQIRDALKRYDANIKK